jgi:hypothetical protein
MLPRRPVVRLLASSVPSCYFTTALGKDISLQGIEIPDDIGPAKFRDTALDRDSHKRKVAD